MEIYNLIASNDLSILCILVRCSKRFYAYFRSKLTRLRKEQHLRWRRDGFNETNLKTKITITEPGTYFLKENCDYFGTTIPIVIFKCDNVIINFDYYQIYSKYSQMIKVIGSKNCIIKNGLIMLSLSARHKVKNPIKIIHSKITLDDYNFMFVEDNYENTDWKKGRLGANGHIGDI